MIDRECERAREKEREGQIKLMRDFDGERGESERRREVRAREMVGEKERAEDR